MVISNMVRIKVTSQLQIILIFPLSDNLVFVDFPSFRETSQLSRSSLMQRKIKRKILRKTFGTRVKF